MDPIVLSAMVSSVNEHYNTPLEVLDPLKTKWSKIILDPCSNPGSIVNAAHTCSGPEIDRCGLKEDWHKYKGLVFVNPPYGRKLKPWVQKCADEAARALEQQTGTEIVLLAPARTDTKFFHKIILPTADEVLLWEGRITFLGAKHPALFPSLLSYWGHRPLAFRRAYAGKGAFMFGKTF